MLHFLGIEDTTREQQIYLYYVYLVESTIKLVAQKVFVLYSPCKHPLNVAVLWSRIVMNINL